MPRRSALVPLLLVAALLAGPVLAASHDVEHGVQSGATHGCVVCFYANGAGHGALPVSPTLAIADAAEVPAPAPVATGTAVTVRLHPIRGPPAVLI